MKKKFWICNQVNATTGEMLLYGFIGEYEAIDDAAFIADLRCLEGQYANINLRINCGGGDVYKGIAIVNAIKASPAKITCYIDGIAASMGAVICAACKQVMMSQYARYMTHRVTAGIGGNADDLRNFATELENLESILASILAEKTGLTVDEAKAKYITTQDRWIGATQAVAEKLVNGIYDAIPVPVPDTETDAKQLFNAYQKVFNIYSLKKTDMKFIALLLGLPENATEADISAAITALKQSLTAAQNTAKEAVKAKAKALVSNAISNGKLTESERADYEAIAEENYPLAEKVIAKLAPAQRPGNMLNRQTPGFNGGTEVVDENDTWDKLLNQGIKAVNECKANDYPRYKRLYEAHYKRALELTA